jgi:hypothetical protein
VEEEAVRVIAGNGFALVIRIEINDRKSCTILSMGDGGWVAGQAGIDLANVKMLYVLDAFRN